MLLSRLTYHGLDGLSGELFGRLESPWGVFLKSNIGLGQFNKGNMNDEDWGGSYVNTVSGQANGRFTYYTADVGYDFLRGTDYKFGGFVGWTYYGQSSDSRGCVQMANPLTSCLSSGDNRVIGGEDTQWNAPRIGMSAEIMLTERWRVSADVAYLPWTDFKGRDYHLLRDLTTFAEQRGNGGGGVQIEGVLSYFITNNISIDAGARMGAGPLICRARALTASSERVRTRFISMELLFEGAAVFAARHCKPQCAERGPIILRRRASAGYRRCEARAFRAMRWHTSANRAGLSTPRRAAGAVPPASLDCRSAARIGTSASRKKIAARG
ncbi:MULTISPECIES: omptin family outer membrane protease [Bradyrhizobium]|uniref:omptin family outer membrane protease n=2 Tax=Bradyrhizobium TaxID=374 RepID=UPI000A5E1B7A|nr:omptin family outer membrane protease [Bradyrhizobium elkanii]MCP1909469.1 hypothetical protein [Bradyrhizobium elkanii]